MQQLLVPIDGSESAEKAAAFAANLARVLGAEVTLVHVYDGPSAAATTNFFGNASALLDDSQAKEAQASIDRAKQAMGGLVAKDHLVEVGPPAERILDVAERLGIDQIIMGSRGLSPLKELLLGSVSERVLRGANCPVTVVR